MAVYSCLAVPADAAIMNFSCTSTMPPDPARDIELSIDTVAANAKTWNANVPSAVLEGPARITDDEVNWAPRVTSVADRVAFVFDRKKSVLTSMTYDAKGNLYTCQSVPRLKPPR
jgi:hypothetical protein